LEKKLADYFKPIANYSYHQNKRYTETFLSKKKLKPLATSINVLYDFTYPEIKGVSGQNVGEA
jgi:hypothetical protein